MRHCYSYVLTTLDGNTLMLTLANANLDANLNCQYLSKVTLDQSSRSLDEHLCMCMCGVCLRMRVLPFDQLTVPEHQ